MDAVLVDLGAVPLVDGSQQHLTVLAEEAPPPGKGEEFGKASPVGLVVVLLLAVATIFLVRSMSKRIRRLPASFDPPAERGGADHPGAATDEPEAHSNRPGARGDGDDAGSARG